MSLTDVDKESWLALSDDSANTALHYMLSAKVKIDNIFGDGYAAKHPELIGAYMQTAAIDFHAASVSVAVQKLRDAIHAVGEVLDK